MVDSAWHNLGTLSALLEVLLVLETIVIQVRVRAALVCCVRFLLQRTAAWKRWTFDG